MQIRNIEMQITLDDGTVVQGSINANGFERRWGADTAHLGACVGPMEQISCVLAMSGYWEEFSGNM